MKNLFRMACMGFILAVGVVVAQKTAIPLPDAGQYDDILGDNLVNRNIPDADDPDFSSTDIFGKGGFFGPGLLGIINVVIGAVAILFIALQGVRMIFARGDAEVQSQAFQKISWVAVGLALVSAAEMLAFDVFDPTQDLIDGTTSTRAVQDVTIRVLTFMKYIMGALVLITMTLAGFNLITNGDSSETQEAEKRLFPALALGVGLVLFAETAVLILSIPELGVDSSVDEIRTGTFGIARPILIQISGSIRFITSFITAGAVLLLVYAGANYAGSFGDDSRQEEAKTMIIGALIALALTISSFSITNFLIKN